eukprot:TRINITY_DN22378_c2_g2_i1.p1 TRINITY_DN22378_c2_g2~~TRINITY_DN22378_c2_g2_i1.p1  ORF type:complete len:356 (+),score=38.94 TRINITY_DN22378_c2_g2_i1:247-1314(+)
MWRLACILLALPCYDCGWSDGKCKYYDNVPEAGLMEIMLKSEPVVFKNGKSVVGGPILESLKNTTELARAWRKKIDFHRCPYSQRPGQGMTTTRGDGVVFCGMVPVDNGTKVWQEHTEHHKLSDVLAYIKTDKGKNTKFAMQHYLKEDGGKSDPMVKNLTIHEDIVKSIHQLQWVNVWGYFNGAQETWLHFDAGENLLMQISGRKKFIMYQGKTDAKHLYPWQMISRFSPKTDDLKSIARDAKKGKEEDDLNIRYFSPVDPIHPDLERFPLFKKAVNLTCDLEPGDVLFMPPCVFHHVISTPDETTKENLALNIWFEFKEREKSNFYEKLKDQMDDVVERFTRQRKKERVQATEL